MPRESAGLAPGFLFFCCQVGAEPALKAELAAARPEWRLAFSRPGFLTFKTSASQSAAPDSDAADLLGATAAPPDFTAPAFARTWGVSLGKFVGESVESLAAAVRGAIDLSQFDCVHVWQRDPAPVGRNDFEPLPTPLAAEVRAALCGDDPRRDPARIPSPGQRAFDCVIVEPLEWWIGWREVDSDPVSGWVGGVPPIELPPGAISRAYLKMEESLRWSQFPTTPGERWAEVGCAPGGASQALVDRGMTVLGIDPAEVDPRLLAQPRFTHLRMRAADVRRREFRNVRWLAADINVAPEFTLDAVEAIVTHEAVDIEGLLLTLKLPDWRLAAELPGYLERVRSWGYPTARARQLAFNRQEVCLAALRPRRPRRTPTAARRRPPSRLRTRRKRLD